MKHVLLMLGIICFLAFSVTGCDSGNKGTESKVEPAAKTAEEPMKAVESGIEKTKEGVDEATEGAQQPIEETKEGAGKVE
jgi:hypothetical protein